jgi:hypothetical protein
MRKQRGAVMRNAGRGVLWFLAFCLSATLATIKFAAFDGTTNHTVATVSCALGALLAILALVGLMYKIDPIFLIAESKDVLRLAQLKLVARNCTPEQFRGLVMSTTDATVLANGQPGVDSEPEEPETVENRDVLMRALGELFRIGEPNDAETEGLV